MVKVGDPNGFYQTSIYQLFHGLTERGAKSSSGIQDIPEDDLMGIFSLYGEEQNNYLDLLCSLREE